MKDQYALARKYLEIENGLKELYGVFTTSFVAHFDFWERLSFEEGIHAEMVQKLIAAARHGRLTFKDTSAQQGLLQNILNDIAYARELARDGKMSAKAAFKHALSFESTIVEKEAFDNFIGGDPEIIEVLEKLKSYSEGHRAKILNYMEKKGVTL